MSQSLQFRFPLLSGMMLLTVCGTGCGLSLSGFVIPLYRAPSGYSETYHDHLDATDSRRVKKELVDPSLSTIHEWMQPVPMAVSGTAGSSSGAGALQGVMPDGSAPGLVPGEIPDLLPGGSPGSAFPKIGPDQPGGAGVPPAPAK